MSTTLVDTQREEYSLLERWIKSKEYVVVGRSVTRIDALEKVLGRAKYVEDYSLPGMLYAKLVKSPVPHGILKGIRPGKAEGLKGFYGLVTASDVPGINEVGYYIQDQPALAEGKVRFHGEPVALALAESPEVAEEAALLAEVDVEELPAVFDPLEALKGEVLVHEGRKGNVAIKTKVRKGDVKRGFEESYIIVEDTYRMGYQDHAYLEPEGALAVPSVDGMTVILSVQYPHLAQMKVARVLGINQSKVRIVQPVIGGAFGGKDDMGPIVAAQAAIAAYKAQKPVLLTYSREDSFTSHCKRDPAVIRYKTGATKDGKLKAIEVEIIFDAGAYANRGPFTLWRATVHASGPYEVPNAKVDGRLVYTNKVYQGSFRGFGNPQVQFAAERQMDELAYELGMDPVEIRLKNVLKVGSLTITNQKLEFSVGIEEALRRVAEASGWRDKWSRYPIMKDGKARGMGVGIIWHGISTSRGVPDWGNAYINVGKDGSATVYTGITEIGQGTHTGLAQIAAEGLGVPLSYVNLIGGTTDAPDTGATHGSRGLNLGGNGILVAATKIRTRVERAVARYFNVDQSEVRIRDGLVYVKGERRLSWKEAVKIAYETGEDMAASGHFFMPKGKFNEEAGQGFAYLGFSYMAVITEVEVDLKTGVTKVLKAWPAIAAGKIINPELVRGQIHGGLIQGLGYAIMEEVKLENGRILNPNFTDYLIPTMTDVPEIAEPIFVEDIFPYGPFGAKGVAEMALIPTPASIGNAIRNATGVKPRELPYTPEKLYFDLKGVKR
jgi:CO/xanthine dehydrogenase Mo-binding subunit